ncbi:carbohydrate kinase family protein [Candidatus Lokiarchaeum ossiferum]|uniref:carbohydrate kinase family protein n=1 Tax=Candidatus Lokiarchaeum ossiferum TaxID=2951803 RepID=UPI00352C59C1
MENRIIVVGELHIDLFYRADVYSSLAKILSQNLFQNQQSYISEEEIESKILHIVNSTNKKIQGNSYLKRGGNGNNSSEILAHLGANVDLLSVVGENSQWMLQELQEIGIGTSNIYIKSSPTPISTIIEDPSITKILLASNCKKEMNFIDIQFPISIFYPYNIVFFTPFAPKFAPIYLAVPKHDKILALTIETQKIHNLAQLELLNAHPCDILFMNLQDIATILQDRSFSPTQTDTAKNSQQVIRNDLQISHFAKIRVYTFGKEGVWICVSNKQPVHIPIISIKVKNRTGAGDTFAAAFLVEFNSRISSKEELNHLDLDTLIKNLIACAKFARIAAALKVKTGKSPTRSEIDLFIQNNSLVIN